MNHQMEALGQRSVLVRYVELDSLRGIAACLVLGNHLKLAFSLHTPWFAVPFFAGHEAVVLFFVLSGFVLSLPFWNKGTSGPYGRYLIRRFFRIYVPFLVALIAAAVGAHFFLFSTLPLGGWFYNTWHTALTPSFLLSQVLMAPDGRLNTAFWSLRYEVQLSIVFPLLLIVLRRLGTVLSLVLALGMNLIGMAADVKHMPDPHWYQQTMQYAAMFIFGALLARNREKLRELWASTGGAFRSIFYVVALVVFFYGNSALRHLHSLEVFGDLCVAVGACMLVLVTIFSRRIRAVLQLPFPAYLGRISYSIYLLHGTILFVLLNLLYGKVPVPVIAVAFFACSFAAAHAFCVLVEEPALRLGKHLSSKAPAGR